MKLLIKSISIFTLIIFVACTNSKPQQKQNDESTIKKSSLSYKEKGMEYALKAKGALGKNLINAISTQGTINALSFCNENALHITDSVAKNLNIQIRRVSDQYRNPNNKANADELAFINAAKNQLNDSKKITPQIQEINGKAVGYYPIVTNKMCLQCHGNPSTEIENNTLLKIKELYPSDMAIGYSDNELRGIWVVTMPKE